MCAMRAIPRGADLPAKSPALRALHGPSFPVERDAAIIRRRSSKEGSGPRTAALENRLDWRGGAHVRAGIGRPATMEPKGQCSARAATAVASQQRPGLRP